MPELPEVETVARGLEASLLGRRLQRVEAARADLRWALPARFAERLTGRKILSIGRRAKYIQVRLDPGPLDPDGLIWLVHLGMSGRFTIAPADLVRAGAVPPPGAHDHIRIWTDDGQRVLFNDARRFGSMDLMAPDEMDRHKLLAGLGPEPFDPALDEAGFSAALAGRATSIKAALLDQRIIAGLGNIYVSEALFRAGISPRRSAGSVSGVRAARLLPAIRSVLTEAIAAGGSTLRDHAQVSGELGYFQHRFAVYDRATHHCPDCTCDIAETGGIRRIVQSGRSTFYCPVKQR